MKKNTDEVKTKSEIATDSASPRNDEIAYDPQAISLKWQEKWKLEKLYQTNLDSANGSSDSQLREPYYTLMMFPYPSAEGLHIGGIYTFTGVDAFARFKRMQGYEVFEPFGLDAFGIHSENYALKIGKHPMDLANQTEENFYRQMQATGSAIDWSRKLETNDPNYYKWTQWLFIQLFKHGLAERKKAKVNFCPSCKTVLADEQVITQLKTQNSQLKNTNQKLEVQEKRIGVCERCGTEVEKRDLEQWFFKITTYADRLLHNIEGLDWAQKVKTAQTNWIGKSEGAQLKFQISNFKLQIEVFTTRPDTLYGVTFLVVAPEHKIVEMILSEKVYPKGTSFSEAVKVKSEKLEEIKGYINIAQNKSEQERLEEGKEKTGVFSGLYATHPLTGEQLPIWIADYVLGSYGTGAIMAVPAHDERDYEFAKKYDLGIKQVIEEVRIKKQESRNEEKLDVGKGKLEKEVGNLRFEDQTSNISSEARSRFARQSHNPASTLRHVTSIFQHQISEYKVYSGEGNLINSDGWNGLKYPQDNIKILSDIEEKGIGERKSTYHLRDWLISRQRYWGPPIPMIYCEKCAKEGKSWFTSEEAREMTNDQFSMTNQDSGQARMTNKKIGNSVQMHGWYPVSEQELPVLLPYIEDFKPLGTGKAPLANHPEFYETTCPECGEKARRETDVSDTFLDSSWYFLRYLATDWNDAPFPMKDSRSKNQEARDRKGPNSSFLIHDSAARLRWLPVTIYIGGAEHSVLHLLYARFMAMFLHDCGYLDFEEPFSKFYAHGLIIKDGAKMSKSKGNVILPDPLIQKFGIDTVRLYLRFLGPFDQDGDFRDTGIEGMHRFVKRVWTMFTKITNYKLQITNSESKRIMHETIKGVTEDMEALRFNTAIAKLMTWYNFLAEQEHVSYEEAKVYLQLLAPFAPHLTEELWQRIKNVELRIKEENKKLGVGNGKLYEEDRGLKLENDSTSSSKSDDQASAFQHPTSYASIHMSSWPSFDPSALVSDEVTIVVQVNGKVRGNIRIINDKLQMINGKERIEKMAIEDERVKKYLEGKTILKTIYIPNKVINFVTE